VSPWRYYFMRGVVGLGLAILLTLPTHLLIGNLTSLIPASLAPVIGLIALLSGVIFGSGIIAEKLSKR
jgi:TRAP-type C4-dicarboxylate transport system permease small subunit